MFKSKHIFVPLKAKLLMCELFQDSWDSYLGAYILDFCPPEPHCGREWSISQTATDVDAPPRRRQRRMNREKD